jgi:hypothetical protein
MALRNPDSELPKPERIPEAKGGIMQPEAFERLVLGFLDSDIRISDFETRDSNRTIRMR